MKSMPLLLMLASLVPAGRPRDPWVFRGSLDGKPGTVFLALHKEMTVAYDEEGCSLFFAWKGGVEPVSGPSVAGPSQSDDPVPDYRAAGAVYHRRLNPAPWSAHGPQGNLKITMKFAGAAVADGRATLAYLMILPGGRTVSIRERPEFDNHYGDNALFRNFEVTGLPEGVSVRLEVGGKGMAETWGGGATGGVEEDSGRWYFVQSSDGETPIKVTWSKPGL